MKLNLTPVSRRMIIGAGTLVRLASKLRAGGRDGRHLWSSESDDTRPRSIEFPSTSYHRPSFHCANLTMSAPGWGLLPREEEGTSLLSASASTHPNPFHRSPPQHLPPHNHRIPPLHPHLHPPKDLALLLAPPHPAPLPTTRRLRHRHRSRRPRSQTRGANRRHKNMAARPHERDGVARLRGT